MKQHKKLTFSVKTSLLTGALMGVVGLGAGCLDQRRTTVNPAPVPPKLPATNADHHNATNNATNNATTEGTTGGTTGAAKLPSKIEPVAPIDPLPEPMCCVNPGPMRIDDGPAPTPITKPTSDKK